MAPQESSRRSGIASVEATSLCICLLILIPWIPPVSQIRSFLRTSRLTLIIVAPATGTPETGGWTTRELREILRGLKGLNIVAADIVEVAPAYDTNAELTTMAAADALYEVMSIMILKGPTSKMVDEDQEEL